MEMKKKMSIQEGESLGFQGMECSRFEIKYYVYSMSLLCYLKFRGTVTGKRGQTGRRQAQKDKGRGKNRHFS